MNTTTSTSSMLSSRAASASGMADWRHAIGRRVSGLSSESRWAIAGLLLAQIMVAVLYLMLVDNVTQIGIKKAAQEELTRQRHYCGLQPTRLERQQCLAELSTRVE